MTTNVPEKCVQSVPEPTDKEIQDNIPNMLQMMGAKACTTAAGGLISWEGAGGFSYTTGCEQISIISQKYLKATNIVTCILNSVKQTVNSRAISTNQIKIKLNNSKMTCDKGLILTQTAYIDLVDMSQVKTQIKNNIINQIKDMINQTMKTFQDSHTDFMSTSQGQKSIQKALDSIKNNMNTYINTDIVTDILHKVSNKNQITIDLNNSTLTGEQCIIKQGSILKLTAQNLFSTAISNAIQNSDFTQFTSDLENYQKSAATGLGSILSSAAIIFILLLVGGFVIFGGGAVSSIFKYIIPILLIVSIVVAIIFGKNKNYLVCGISSGAAVLLGVFEYMSLKKGTGMSSNVKNTGKKSKKN